MTVGDDEIEYCASVLSILIVDTPAVPRTINPASSSVTSETFSNLSHNYNLFP